jgi:hypothetical protein
MTDETKALDIDLSLRLNLELKIAPIILDLTKRLVFIYNLLLMFPSLSSKNLIIFSLVVLGIA